MALDLDNPNFEYLEEVCPYSPFNTLLQEVPDEPTSCLNSQASESIGCMDHEKFKHHLKNVLMSNKGGVRRLKIVTREIENAHRLDKIFDSIDLKSPKKFTM